jgi:cobalt/nickel transport system permease protein
VSGVEPLAQIVIFLLVLWCSGALVPNAYAMHITEGILPLNWAIYWYVGVIPFLVYGVYKIKRMQKNTPFYLPLLGMIASAVFVFSSFPIPVPFTGAVSHPVGVGLAAIVFGPAVACVISLVTLLIQALFLAHGGISTLGANLFSLGVVGSLAGYGAFKLGRIFSRQNLGLPSFAAGFFAGIFTYFFTAFELGLALHGTKSVPQAVGGIFCAFLPTQLPLAILEGVLTAGLIVYIQKRRPEILKGLKII